MPNLFIVRFLVAVLLAPPGLGQAAQPRISITISTARETVVSGDDIFIKIQIKNISDQDTMVARSNRDDQGEFHFTTFVHNQTGVSLRSKKQERNAAEGKTDLTSMVEETMIFFTLKPGDILKDGIFVSRAFDMTKAGKYSIQVERVDDETKTVLKSNTITVTVTR